MINFVATATLAIGLLAAAPKAPQWETSYGKALEETRAGRTRCWWCSISPTAKKLGSSRRC